MASSTRGGKRGKKSRALRMYKTPGGAMQYGTPDAFRRAAKNAGKSDPENFDKYDTAIAGWAGAMSEEYGEDPFYKSMERRKKKSVQNKKYGGAVRGYEGGGEVCRGNGRAYQGKPKKVQVR